jgi:hypothetical protein
MCSRRLRGSPANQYQMRGALRDILPTCLFDCLVLLDGLFSRRRLAASHVALCRDGGGRFFFSTALCTRATKHEAAHEETEAVAGTAVAARARAV